uniref:Uncharacterized protein n=1 Tax=Schistosoma mansoni TaxID=6183 RepID=A0A5K4F6F7_SCHMA
RLSVGSTGQLADRLHKDGLHRRKEKVNKTEIDLLGRR